MNSRMKTGNDRASINTIIAAAVELLKKDVSLIAMVTSCILLFVVGSLLSPTFLSAYNLQNLLRHSATLGTIAIGITVVFLIKEVDISVGSVMAFSIFFSANVTKQILSLFGVQAVQGGHYMVHGMVPLILFTLIISTSIGFINGIIVTKFRINSVITTLGMLYVFRGLCYIVSGGHSLFLTQLANFGAIGSGNILGIPVPAIVFLFLGAVTVVLLSYSIIGRRVYAIGGNERAAKLAGIDTGAWKIFAFMLSGFMAGVAGLLYSSYLQSANPNQGVGYEFSAIAIVVLGGTVMEGGKGGVGGTLGAAFVIGLLNNVLDLVGVDKWYQNVLIGVIIVISVLPSYIRKKEFE